MLIFSEKFFSFARYSFSSGLPGQNHQIFILGLLLVCGDEGVAVGALLSEGVGRGLLSGEFSEAAGVFLGFSEPRPLVILPCGSDCALGLSGPGGFVGSDVVLVAGVSAGFFFIDHATRVSPYGTPSRSRQAASGLSLVRGMDDPLTVITVSLLCSVSTGSGGLFFIGGVLLLASVAGVAFTSSAERGASVVDAFSASAGFGFSVIGGVSIHLSD